MKKQSTKYYLAAALPVIFALSFLLFSTMKNNSAAASDLDYEQSKALFEVNDYRKENGLKELKWDDRLSRAAMLKLQDEDMEDYFDHVSPDGKRAWDFIKITGYKYRFAGENLAIDFEDEPAAFDAWEKSQSHKDNILSENYDDFGFASLKANIDGVDRVLMVQIFGSKGTVFDRILSSI